MRAMKGCTVVYVVTHCTVVYVFMHFTVVNVVTHCTVVYVVTYCSFEAGTICRIVELRIRWYVNQHFSTADG